MAVDGGARGPEDGWLYRSCSEKRDLALVRHSLSPRRNNPNPNDADLNVAGHAEFGLARPCGRTAVGPSQHGGIGVHDFVHRLTCLQRPEAVKLWGLDTTSVSHGVTSGLRVNIDTLAYFTAERFRARIGFTNPVPDSGALPAAQGWHAQLLYKCRENAWDALFWEVVRDADYDVSGHAVVCPRADVPEDATGTRYKMVPTSHSAYLLQKLDAWEFVGILFRAKTAAKLYEWLDEADGSRVRAVVFAVEALLDVMDRIPALMDELEPIALQLLEANVKTVDDLVKALTPFGAGAWESLLCACGLYDDYSCARYCVSHNTELLVLKEALSSV